MNSLNAAGCLLALVTIFASACKVTETGVLRAELAFTIDGESGLTAARDFTIDRAGNVFIFDYGDYVIRKFSPEGTQLAFFGGTGVEPGLFQHLMAIRVVGDSLLALDAGSVSVFDLAGEFRSRRSFIDTVICDLPKIHTDGSWAGEWIIEETAEKVLTSRDPDGVELDKLESFALNEFFPGVQPGEMFFINPTQLRSYVYDFGDEGRLVWAVSNRLQVFAGDDGVRRELYHAEATAIPYPPEEIVALETRQAASEPPFFLNVPTHYQVIHQLAIDDDRNIWLYVKSEEHTGLLCISPTGGLTGSYQLQAEFDPTAVRMAVANGRLYFMSGGREGVRIFFIDVQGGG